MPDSAPQVLKGYMIQIGLIDSCRNNSRAPKRKRGSRDTGNTDDTASDPNWEPSVEGLEGTSGLTLAATGASCLSEDKPAWLSSRFDVSSQQHAHRVQSPLQVPRLSLAATAPDTPRGPRVAAGMSAPTATPTAADADNSFAAGQGAAVQNIAGIAGADLGTLLTQHKLSIATRSMASPTTAGMSLSLRAPGAPATVVASDSKTAVSSLGSPLQNHVPNGLEYSAPVSSPLLRVLSHSSRQDSSISSNSKGPAHMAAAGGPQQVMLQAEVVHNVDTVCPAPAGGCKVAADSSHPSAAAAGDRTATAAQKACSPTTGGLLGAQHAAAAVDSPVLLGATATATACASAVAEAQESEEIEHTLMWLQTADDQVRTDGCAGGTADSLF